MGPTLPVANEEVSQTGYVNLAVQEKERACTSIVKKTQGLFVKISLDTANKISPPDRIMDDHFPPRVKQRALAILIAYGEKMNEEKKYKKGYKWDRICKDINLTCKDVLADRYNPDILKPQNLQSFEESGGGIGNDKFFYINLFIERMELDGNFTEIRDQIRRYMISSYATFLSDYYNTTSTLTDMISDSNLSSFPWYFESQDIAAPPQLFNDILPQFQIACRMNQSYCGSLHVQIVRLPSQFDLRQPIRHFDPALSAADQTSDYILSYSGFLVIVDSRLVYAMDTGADYKQTVGYITGSVKARSYNCEKSLLGIFDAPFRLGLIESDQGLYIPTKLQLGVAHTLRHGVEKSPELILQEESDEAIELKALQDTSNKGRAAISKYKEVFSSIYAGGML